MSVTLTHTAVYLSGLSAKQCMRFEQALQRGTFDTELAEKMPHLSTVYSQGFSFSGKSGFRAQILFPVIRLHILTESPCLVRVNIQPNLTALLVFLGVCLGVALLLMNLLTQYYNLNGWAELLLACAALALLSLTGYLSIFQPIEQGRQWIIDQLQLNPIRPKANGQRK